MYANGNCVLADLSVIEQFESVKNQISLR